MSSEKIFLSPDYFDAITFTGQLHNAQFRKSGNIPYVTHLLTVSALVLEAGGTEDEAIAALLHDALEDQGPAHGGSHGLRDRIVRRFGGRVLEIVEGCTDTDIEPKPPWKERKSAFIDGLRTADESTCIVVAADKLHNTRALRADISREGVDAAWARFKQPVEENLWYYRTIADLLASRLTGRGRWLAEELQRTVSELEIASKA